MKVITKQKDFQEIEKLLGEAKKVYLIGCGTCATLCKTGGKLEVLAMKESLEKIGKTVTGWMVIPTACDVLTLEALKQEAAAIKKAEVILALACGFGVQRIAGGVDKLVIPALDSLFISQDDITQSEFTQVCAQCGECVLGVSAGICPIVTCHKGLLNGPCGGTNKGKCEVDKEKDCAWTLIYQKLNAFGRLDLMEQHHPPKNYQKTLKPGKCRIES